MTSGLATSMWTRSIALCAGVLAALVATSCTPLSMNTGGVKTAFNIDVLSKVDNTKNHPANVSFTVNASCATGAQLVGGGYLLIGSDAFPILVVVEANFPSATNVWTVQARNPDNAPFYTGDSNVAVDALAYCMTTPNYDLGTEIQTGTATLPHSNAATDIEARCSQSSGLALSGGFKTTSLPPSPGSSTATYQTYWPGLDGTGITGSGPRLRDATHTSMGWHVTQQYVPAQNWTAPQPDVSTTVYVLCANKNISNQAARVVTASGTPAGGNLAAPCGTGEFAIGGGYDGATTLQFFTAGNTPAINSSVADNAAFAFGGWQLTADSNGKLLDALAWCVHIPQI